MRASDSLLDGGVDRIFPIAASGSESDNSAVGQDIARAIVNRFSLNHDPGFRALARDAQIARIGSNLLQRALRGQIIQRGRNAHGAGGFAGCGAKPCNSVLSADCAGKK